MSKQGDVIVNNFIASAISDAIKKKAVAEYMLAIDAAKKNLEEKMMDNMDAFIAGVALRVTKSVSMQTMSDRVILEVKLPQLK